MEHALSYLLHSCLIVSYPLFSSAIPSSLMLFCAVLSVSCSVLSCPFPVLYRPNYIILSYHVLSCFILSYPILPILSCTILHKPLLLYPVLSYPVLSYPVLSSCPASPILSCPILSYPAYPALFCVISDLCIPLPLSCLTSLPSSIPQENFYSGCFCKVWTWIL